MRVICNLASGRGLISTKTSSEFDVSFDYIGIKCINRSLVIIYWWDLNGISCDAMAMVCGRKNFCLHFGCRFMTLNEWWKMAIYFNLEWSAQYRILLFWNRKIFIELVFQIDEIHSVWLHAKWFTAVFLFVFVFVPELMLVAHEMIRSWFQEIGINTFSKV